MNTDKQQGLVLVTGLLFLLVMTFIGIVVVGQGVIQTKLAAQLDETSMAFSAAEAGIEAVIHEQEGTVIAELDKALSLARQADAQWDIADPISCFGNVASGADPVSEIRDSSELAGAADKLVIARELDSTGLSPDSLHASSAALSVTPPVGSWSRSVFIGEDNLLLKGGEAETVDAGFAFHAFLIRGCGQAAGSPMAAATQLNVAVMGPKVE